MAGPSQDVIKVAIISDIHLTPENREQAEARLAGAVEDIRSFDPGLTVVLGDMIGDAETESGLRHDEEGRATRETLDRLDSVREIVEQLDSETLFLKGNHEQAVGDDQFRQVFGQEPFGHLELGEDIVFMDSSAPRLSGSRGELDREQMEFLDSKLAELEDVLFFIHHPIHYRNVEDTYWFDFYPERAFCGNKKEVNRIIENRRCDVKAVFNGHLHRRDHTVYEGRDHFTMPPFIAEDRSGFDGSYALLEMDEAAEIEIMREGGRIESWRNRRR